MSKIKSIRQLHDELLLIDSEYTTLEVKVSYNGSVSYRSYINKTGYVDAGTPEELIALTKASFNGARQDIDIEPEPTVTSEQPELFPDPMDGATAINQIKASTEGLPPGPSSAANIEEVYPGKI